MMRVAVLCSSILHLWFCVQSLPVHDKTTNSRSQQVQRWPPGNHHAGLQRRARLEQDTLKEEYHLKSLVSLRNDTEFWKRPRCGVPDYPTLTQVGLSYYDLKKRAGLNGQQRRKRYALFGRRWEKKDLTYKIMRFPWQMNEVKVRHILQEALSVWSEVTPLRFKEVTAGKADIIIDFNRYWHGDALPFDGPGGILAHAFFPRTHREGEIHFDYDEDWTVGNDVGTDLLQVAAHEFGHVLGLQHSLEPGAVMSPFYSASYPLQLSDDDKRGIQYLYGPPQHVPPEITETNEIDIAVPDACTTNFDAVSMIRGELFFFKSQYVWRIRDGQLQAGYPALASRHWRGIPDHIDAVHEDKSGNIWFFQGDSYWVFDGERKITGPDYMQQLGLPVSNIQAAVKWDDDGAKKVYLFKSHFYWHFNPEENRVSDFHPYSTYDWGGMPSNIDAAFQDRYGYTNFLSGLNYWKFDPVVLTVLEGYPRNIGMDFFGCPAVPLK
ncbi:stromelysin-3-like [Thalassophryne amazonica]|uniref:stromelysin-3-like n=1 Tax=Thalassophryne amazonica TaxID=390379 RepID=UPI0014714816|nr:stromelysin-3-like [Thalassophryne amazonica]